ncbi:tRNA (N(6)-L-threonylcarbamoyladenosine(37)-C(2))-methylthiotransferase MtaB [Treponema sp. R80B11-R83G3]
MLSFLIQTLGCKLNQLESEAITDAFLRAGFDLLKFDGGRAAEEPSIVIINTCTVTSKADQKARRVIRKALRDYPESSVLVTGCYAQLNREDLLKLDNGKKKRLFVIKKDSIIDLPSYYNENEQIGGMLEKFSESPQSDARDRIFQFNPQSFSSHTRSFLKIQDGCNNNCTYCRIRLARGASVSLDADEVLSRLRILDKNHAEAVLTGVNISQYRDKNEIENCANLNLARLLEYLLNGTEKIALRLSSLAPDSIDEELAGVLANKRIRPHFHLSIQSCSKKILEKMGRSYGGKTVEDAVSLLRRAKGDPFLACDIITGFPGETEREFKETYELCKKLDFAWIHVFPYSKRPGTAAFSFPGTVHETEVTRRLGLFTALAEQGRANYAHRWFGREVDVLVEKGGGKSCRGVSENYLKILIVYNGEKPPPPGEVLRCKLLERHDTDKAEEYDAVAEIIPVY